jgi:hypothetical protein
MDPLSPETWYKTPRKAIEAAKACGQRRGEEGTTDVSKFKCMQREDKRF